MTDEFEDMDFGSDDFGVNDPDKQGGTGPGSRDAHFIRFKDDEEGPGIFGINAEKNLFVVLPPFSDWRKRFAEMKKEGKQLSIACFYNRLPVRLIDSQYTNNYRVPMDNPITEAFKEIYNALKDDSGKFTPALKEIAGYMTGGGLAPKPRAVINILCQSDRQLRWLDTATLSPSDVKKGSSEPSVTCHLKSLISKIKEDTTDIHPKGVYYWALETGVLMSLEVGKNGNILVPRKPQPYLIKRQYRIVNSAEILKKNSAEWQEEGEAVLDKMSQWCEEYDELPPLDKIGSSNPEKWRLINDGRCCDILKLECQASIKGKGSDPGKPKTSSKKEERAGKPAPVEEEEPDPFGDDDSSFSTMDQSAAELDKRFGDELDSAIGGDTDEGDDDGVPFDDDSSQPGGGEEEDEFGKL